MTPKNKKTCDVYIISWKDMHDNAIEIAKSLVGINGKVVIVYSDPEPNFLLPHIEGILSIKRPDEEFFGPKFKACLDDCDADLMMIIHADTENPNWRNLFSTGYESMINHSSIGIWAPYIEWTPRKPSRTNIGKIGESSFVFTAWTDTTIFCIRKQTIKRLRGADYSKNNFGWGITPMMVAHVCTLSLIPVVDYSVKAFHRSGPNKRGYPSETAAEQKMNFLEQLSPKEKVILKLMDAIQNRNEMIESLKNQIAVKNEKLD